MFYDPSLAGCPGTAGVSRLVSCFLRIGTILWNKELNCRQAQGQKTRHRDSAATCTYRLPLEAIA